VVTRILHEVQKWCASRQSLGTTDLQDIFGKLASFVYGVGET